MKGADYAVLDSYCRYVVTAGKALGINIGGRYVLHRMRSHSVKHDIYSVYMYYVCISMQSHPGRRLIEVY